MFSQLGPLFKTHLRQAERSDARLEIRRDEKQDQGKKQEFAEEDDTESDLWSDSTAVSVEALRTFLIEFLKSKGDSVPEENAGSVSTSSAPAETLTPASNRAARAVKAYSAMASQTAAPPPAADEQSAPEDLVSLLRSDELRTMHLLIAELDRLSRRGVQTLVIGKADTFLEALVLAVRDQA